MNEIPMTDVMQQALVNETEPQAPVSPVSQQDMEAVKEMLGVKQLEEQNAQQGQLIQTMQSEAIYKDALAKTISAYPELTPKMLEDELARIEKSDANLAKSARTPLGLEMIARGLKTTIKPEAKPDEITDDGATSAQAGNEDNELESLINSGKANKFQLGEFLGKLKKK